ncbi:MAG TPA: type II toxin-antitoxin system prevent-host-death family antitoxin [Thermomicrobiales bacterium]|nr:type II toxin-antitoxin system prevent-host-death family antitoxin [Thermomicrobiales bacterium]
MSGRDMAEQMATQTIKISDVKQQLNSLVNRVYRRETRVIVEKSGIPVAGIVSAEDVRRLERLDEERAERFAILDAFGDAFKDVTAEELEREVARALAEARARRRSERQTAAAATT